MDRTSAPHHIDIGSGKRGFRDQNIAVGKIGTRVEAAFLNSVQEEILNVIEKAGIAPNSGDWTQLWQALQRLNAPGYQGRHHWHGVVSMSVTVPPNNAPSGAAYLIPANAEGDWAGKGGQIAIRDENVGNGGWLYISPQDGHGVGLPDGSVYVREGGQYQLLRTLYQNFFDNRYSRLTAPPVGTFYVNDATGSDGYDGMSPEWPFKSIQGAVNTISSKYLTFARVTIQVAPGEYGGFSVYPSLVQSWKFVGDAASPASTVINATSLAVNNGRSVVIGGNEAKIEGFKFLSLFENCGASGGNLEIENCHITLPPNTSAVSSYGSRLGLYSAIRVIGQGSFIFVVSNGGMMQLGYQDAASSRPCALIYENASADFNFYATLGGSVTFHPAMVSFAGSLSAKRYLATMNGSVETYGAGVNWIAGNQAGETSTGGQFN